MGIALKTSPATRRSSSIGGAKGRVGFTLVEMLISVALVLLMMTLFAQVFQMAGNSISKQRGLAENDQRSRMLQTMIKSDLDNRSFISVMPFAPGETLTEAYKRDGYFYISDNNTANGIDDVLQFTVQLKSGADQYYGKALSFPATDSASPPNLDFSTNPFTMYPNQPDVDDSQVIPNNTGSSMLAEVSYFVRNGNLYRRQLLIRQPPAIPGTTTQPDTGTGNLSPASPPVNLFSTAMTNLPAYPQLLGTMVAGKPYATSFWNDFDYSAYYSGATTCAAFSGRTSLQNDGTSFGSLGNPQLRFGHDSSSGLPKEFLTYSGTPTGFVGRYTLEECSNSAFQYPQSASLNPMAFAFPGTAGSYDVGNDGVVSGFKGGLRRGEDLLISNVHAFDIQILDEAAGQFVNLTAPNTTDYSLTNQINTAYGPFGNTGTNAVFDTWHPKIDWNTDTIWDSPPFFPQKNIPGSASSTATTWTANKTYSIGDRVFPTTTLRIAPYFYQCVQTTTGANSGSSATTPEPTWPLKGGLKVGDNQLIWQAVDNRKPLKAVKIEIRFLDVSTQQMRQMTMIHSLVD
ncbi:MAG: hypothetical protein JWP89_888 [Schlesneria sp.]|nr:hypothetical protein [Schlesneria sp.]